MRHLNYNHLHYFWVVATTGSIAEAARSLHVTPQTISGQLRTLEARLGSALFQRNGGKLGLSETGQMVHSYVNPMFSLGWELGAVLERRAPRRPSPLSVGIATGIGQSIASRVLAAAVEHSGDVRVRCHETSNDRLVAALSARRIDLAVTDAPVSSSDTMCVRSHLIGRCGTTFFCLDSHADRYRARFPASLHCAPFALPAGGSAAASLVEWFRLHGIAPAIVAEIENPDLCSALCEANAALFAAPAAIASEVERKYGVSAVGHVPDLEQEFYVTCAERPIRHERIVAVIETARARFRAPLPPDTCDRCARSVLDECVA